MQKKKQKRKKLKPLRSLALKAWSLISLIVRTKGADSNGYVSCVTCEKIDHWKNMHCGHFFHASKQSQISYDFRNLNVQCPGCNTYRGGARDHYACYLVKRYGAHVLDELQTLKHQGHILRRQELEDKIVELQVLLSELTTP